MLSEITVRAQEDGGQMKNVCGCFSLLPSVTILKCLFINALELKTVQLCLCKELLICNSVCGLTDGFVVAASEALLIVMFPFFSSGMVFM